MTVVDLGVRELQRDTSRVIREVEDTGTSFRITVQGRPTSVMLSRVAPRESGATLEQVRNSPLYRKSAEVVAAQLAFLERSRDEAGFVGQA